MRETGPEAVDLSGEWTLALNVGGQQGREEEPHLQRVSLVTGHSVKSESHRSRFRM